MRLLREREAEEILNFKERVVVHRLRDVRFLYQALKMRFLTHRPIFLSHMITSLCDCRCAFCHYWKLGKRQEMTTRQVLGMLGDARDAGFTDYIVWGGEPLLRPDLPRILSHANRLGLDNTLITNGSRLTDRIGEIGEDLYGLIVSLDYPEPELHDNLRRRKGIFRRAIDGIDKARNFSHLNIFINCVVHKGNSSYLRDMAELARELGVKITYEMMETVKGYNEHLSLTAEEETDVALELLELKSQGYPIANSSAYFKALAAHTKYKCHVPKVLVTVEWDGAIRVCSTIAEDNRPDLMEYSLGNVVRNTFREIFASKNYLKYIEAAEKCYKCDLSYPREIALIYSFNSEAIRNFFSKITEINLSKL